MPPNYGCDVGEVQILRVSLVLEKDREVPQKKRKR